VGTTAVLLKRAVFWALVALGSLFASTAPAETLTVSGRGLALEFDDHLHSRVIAVFGTERVPLGPLSASETVQTSSAEVADFALREADHSEETIPPGDPLGAGRRHRLVGRASPSGLEKTVEISLYDDFPNAAVMQTTYTNTGAAPVTIASWTQNRYAISVSGTSEPAFWSYQSGSYEPRPDWVLPLKKGFRQENFQGMNADDYGGGTPVADVWRRDAGVAVGHLELVPKLVSLPVMRPTREQATLAVRQAVGRVLAPGEKLTTLRTFVAVHRGDHFRSLELYSALMQRQGVRLPTAPPDAHQIGSYAAAGAFGRTRPWRAIRSR